MGRTLTPALKMKLLIIYSIKTCSSKVWWTGWNASMRLKSKHRCNFLTRTNLMKFLACRYLTILSLWKKDTWVYIKLVVRRAPPKGLPIWPSICIHQIQHKMVIILTSLPINMKKLDRVQNEGLLKYHHLGQAFYGWPIKRSHFLSVVLLEVTVSSACC
jgi:hypothetical protein